MKLAKLSLAAIVAAGALTSVASASSLEEAIKGVSINGYVRYRHNSKKPTEADTDELKIVAGFTVPVTDGVKVTVQGASNNVTSNGTLGDKDVTITRAYFTYTGVQNLTVRAGKQSLPTPFFDPIDERGMGIVALYNAGAATIAAAAITDAKTDKNGDVGNDVYGVGVIGSVDVVNAQAWYVDVQDCYNDNSGKKAYAVLADAKVAGVATVFGAYAAVNDDDSTSDPSQWRLGVSGNAGPVALTVAYAATDSDGGDVTLGGDTDAKVNFQVQQASMSKTKDANAWYVAAGMDFGAGFSGKAEYLQVNDDITTGVALDPSEYKLTLNYKVSKNLNTYVWYSNLDKDDNTADSKISRVEVKYTF